MNFQKVGSIFVPQPPAGTVDRDPPKPMAQATIGVPTERGSKPCPGFRCGKPISATKPFCKTCGERELLRQRAEKSGLVLSV